MDGVIFGIKFDSILSAAWLPLFNTNLFLQTDLQGAFELSSKGSIYHRFSYVVIGRFSFFFFKCNLDWIEK